MIIALVMLMKSILPSLNIELSDISKRATINTSHRLTDSLSVVSLKISQTLHMIFFLTDNEDIAAVD